MIEIDAEAESKGEELTFDTFPDHNLAKLDRRQVCEQLVESGLWTALRTRPFSKVPALDMVPAAVFVTAMDTNPLAADPAITIDANQGDFIAGLEVLSTLTSGQVQVCRKAGADIPGEGKTPCSVPCVRRAAPGQDWLGRTFTICGP